MKRIKYFLLGLFGHGKGCDRALGMAHMHHEHAKVHYAHCEKCRLAVDFIEPEYTGKRDG